MHARLLEKDRSLFEHWTHDAAAIPTTLYPHWAHRFEASRGRIARNAWWQARLGPDHTVITEHVRERIEREGPLQSKDFETDTQTPRIETGWWGWKPQKAALEYLWHTGTLGITRRVHFQKVYDLMGRVLPAAVGRDVPEPGAHLDWACRSALERLAVATPNELAGFWRAVDRAAATRWCEAAAGRGEIVPVRLAGVDGSRPVRAYAFADWRRRAQRLPDPPERIRVLAPFDPLVHDRRRSLRLFGFDFRFEAFVPKAKRTHGYYVMPILEGERFVGRLDPEPRPRQAERGNSPRPVRARHVWWEPGVRATRARRQALAEALERLGRAIDPED
jgi:uncharacterized protein YcaQ